MHMKQQEAEDNILDMKPYMSSLFNQLIGSDKSKVWNDEEQSGGWKFQSGL